MVDRDGKQLARKLLQVYAELRDTEQLHMPARRQVVDMHQVPAWGERADCPGEVQDVAGTKYQE
jgi:hypothetical protein